MVSEAQNKHSTSHAEVSSSRTWSCLKGGLMAALIGSQGSHAAVELQALHVSQSGPGGTAYQPLEA